MRNATLFLGTAVLALSLACGGSSTPQAPAPAPKATGLDYVNPTSTGWRFVKNASSTPQHLVLDLVTPASGSGRGVGITLQVDTTKAAWSKVSTSDGMHLKPGSVYAMGTGTKAAYGRPAAGTLALGLFQKGRGNAAAYNGSSVVLSVALDYVSAANLDPGAIISLAASKAKHLGAADAQLQDLQGQVALGTLKAQ